MRFPRVTLAGALLTLVAAAAGAQLPAPNSITVTLGPDPSTSNPKAYLLVVEANEVTDLYGVGFDFKFPKKLLRWRKKTQKVGDLLSESGVAETTILVRQKPRGNIIVGASRKGQVAGVTGSGTVLTIGFINKKKNGERVLELLNNAAFDSAAEELTEVTWTLEPFQEEAAAP